MVEAVVFSLKESLATPDHVPTHAIMPSTDDTKYAMALDKLKKAQCEYRRGTEILRSSE